MKIAFFTTGMTRGGAERVIATVANRLVEMGHDALVIMLKGKESEYWLDDRVKLVGANLEAGAKNALAALKFYKRTVGSENPDVVIAFTLKPNLMACAAKRWFGVRVPLVVSERSNPFKRNLRLQLVCNNLFSVADGMVCQSKTVSCYYEGRVRSVSATVIPNPVDVTCIAESPVVRERGRYLLSVGRLCEQKRQDLAIRAFAALKSAYPDLRLEICGVGDLENELRDLAARLDVSESVLFCGNVNNVMREKADATAYIMTSDFEGFPNALIETLASGIPVVSTDFSPGVVREIVQEGVNGFVVPAGDATALTDATKRLLDAPLSVEELEKSARAVRKRFDLGAVVGQWLEVCERATEKNG